MRFLLRPSWVAFIVAVLAFAVACYTFLAPWQFGREAERDSQQHAIDVANAAPPVPLAQLSPPGQGTSQAVEWRQATLTGTYLPDAQVLVRLRVHDGGPAYEVITPMRTDDGRLVAVDRGYVDAVNGSVVPVVQAPPAGPVTVTGRLRLNETDPKGRGVITEDGARQVYVVDSAAIGAATGLALESGYVQLSAGAPGVLAPVAVAPAAAGRAAPFTNFSYALQWLTFGAIAVFALIWFIRLEVMQRRGDQGKRTRSELRAALAGDDED